MEKIIALLDAGITYAISDQNDEWNSRAIDFLRKNSCVLIMPDPSIAEASYLINRSFGADKEAVFLESIVKGDIRMEPPGLKDIKRAIEIIRKYKNLNLGYSDSILIAIAERMKIENIFTADRKHFSCIRPLHCKYFILLP